MENTGKRDGAEVVQLYLSSCACAVVRPVKELKAYRRVFLRAGESERITIHLTREDFSYYDEAMVFGLHNGEHTLLLGTSSEDIFETLALKATDGRLEPQEETQCN